MDFYPFAIRYSPFVVISPLAASCFPCLFPEKTLFWKNLANSI
jgi:hypothetical protein